MSSTEAAASSVTTSASCAWMSACVTASGFMAGNSSTSRMAGWSQKSITMRSMP